MIKTFTCWDGYEMNIKPSLQCYRVARPLCLDHYVGHVSPVEAIPECPDDDASGLTMNTLSNQVISCLEMR